MDLGAYANIEDLDEIAKKNNIEVPRLRGYRLMSEETPVNILKAINKDRIAIQCVEDLCESIPFWRAYSNMYESISYFIYSPPFNPKIRI